MYCRHLRPSLAAGTERILSVKVRPASLGLLRAHPGDAAIPEGRYGAGTAPATPPRVEGLEAQPATSRTKMTNSQ